MILHHDRFSFPAARLAWAFVFCAICAGSSPAPAAERNSPSSSSQAYISTRLINHFLARSVSEKTSVSEWILNAYTEGTQITTGQLSVRTLPSNDQAIIELVMKGESHCTDNVSRRGPATVYSSAATGFVAQARLSVADYVLRVESVTANSNTSATLHEVESRSRLLEPLVRRRAGQKVGEMEQAAADRHSERVSERLREEVTRLTRMGNEILADKVRKPALEANAWPQLRFASDPSGVRIEAIALANNDSQLRPPPPAVHPNTDFYLSLHDSFLEQVAERFLGGKEVTDAQILNIVELLAGTAPRPLWVHDRSVRWSVVLAERPLQVSFRDGALHVVIHVAETVRDERRDATPVRISASFEARPSVDGLVLVRRGEESVELLATVGEAGAANDHEELQRFLARKFGAILPPEFHFDALAPPAGGFGEKFRQIPPRNVVFENGWFAIDYELKPSDKP